MTRPKDFDEYCSRHPKATQKLLRQLQSTIKRAAPQATEVISYGMPAFKLSGMLVYFAAYKNHIGFYPFRSAINFFRHELDSYITSSATVRLPLDQPLPLELISKIVKFRVNENLEWANGKVQKTKPPAKKKTLKPTETEIVEEYMKKIIHPLKTGMNALRDIIKKSDSRIRERIKWNAPSYYYLQDMVTFGPLKKDKIMLVFHHPSVVEIKSKLLEGKYKNRRLARFSSLKDITTNRKELTAILKKIVGAIEKDRLVIKS